MTKNGCDGIVIMVGCVKEITAGTLQITQKYSNIYHQNLLRILATNTEPDFKSSGSDKVGFRVRSDTT